MRVAIVILFFSIIFGFISVANAQVTAVMQAKVNVISGAGLTSVQESAPDLTAISESDEGSEIHAGAFSFISSPGVDVTVQITEEPDMKNENGEQVEIETSLEHETNSGTGEHNISLNGSVKNQQQLSGHYKGALTAVIEYL